MKEKKWCRKIAILVISMMLASNITAFASNTEENAARASDVQGHWAQSQMMNWIDKGLIKGYADGTIGVNKPISRQEVAVIVSRLLKLEMTDSSSTEVPYSCTETHIY